MSSPEPRATSAGSAVPSVDSLHELATFSGNATARYHPLLLLGHGGMGSVEAAAEDMNDGTTRVVALKRILRTAGGSSTDAPRIEMFLREARLTTLLQHPNVIRSFAYGESSGEVFLAMEYVAGEPLSRLLSAIAEERSRLPLPVVAYILAEACEGLHAAHELRGPDGVPLGVVHRDVSPHNVMVGYDGTVKLLDFGVAKIDLVDCAARTKTGEVKGKTAYMSPEQAMGDPVDQRSDLYSVGAVLFECVTGRRIWGTGTDLDVLRKLALEDPPRMEEVTPEAPPELASLYARLIQRDRTRRPESAMEVALALRAYIAGSGAQVDASAVRSTMTRLFEGERERRETAIARALLAETNDGPAPALAERPGAGESGPVFVTNHGLGTPASLRRQPRIVAAVVGIAVAVGLGGFVFMVKQQRARVDVPAASREGVPAAVTAATTKPASSASPESPSPAETTTASAAPSSPITSATPSGTTGRTITPLPFTSIGRRKATPVVGRPIAPPEHSAPVASAPSAASTASTASATRVPPTPPTKTTEPPDVDPTPF
jgi:hypothetical protein